MEDGWRPSLDLARQRVKETLFRFEGPQRTNFTPGALKHPCYEKITGTSWRLPQQRNRSNQCLRVLGMVNRSVEFPIKEADLKRDSALGIDSETNEMTPLLVRPPSIISFEQHADG